MWTERHLLQLPELIQVNEKPSRSRWTWIAPRVKTGMVLSFPTLSGMVESSCFLSKSCSTHNPKGHSRSRSLIMMHNYEHLKWTGTECWKHGSILLLYDKADPSIIQRIIIYTHQLAKKTIKTTQNCTWSQVWAYRISIKEKMKWSIMDMMTWSDRFIRFKKCHRKFYEG